MIELLLAVASHFFHATDSLRGVVAYSQLFVVFAAKHDVKHLLSVLAVSNMWHVAYTKT